MAILRDHFNNNKLLELQIISRDKRLDQGCQLLVTIDDTGSNTHVEFGWTNETLNKFIEMLDKFPMELYDGYFSHYDESFEWKWYYEQATDLYLVIIFLSGWIPTLKVSAEELRRFGAQVVSDIDHAPDINYKV
ncbi:hypothetical protein D3C74_72590 [compost metagenome]